MYKIGIIDDEDIWSNLFIKTHQDLFRQYDINPIKVELKPNMPLEELVELVKQENLLILFLDENLTEKKAVGFQGHELVIALRDKKIYRPVYYFTNKKTAVEEDEIFKMCDGIFDKTNINNKSKSEYKDFQKQFIRIVQKGKDIVDEEKEVIQKINFLSLKIAQGSFTEEDLKEHQRLSDGLGSTHLYEHSSERLDLLKKLEEQLEKLDALVDEAE